MKRVFCITFVTSLALMVHAKEDQPPPLSKNQLQSIGTANIARIDDNIRRKTRLVSEQMDSKLGEMQRPQKRKVLRNLNNIIEIFGGGSGRGPGGGGPGRARVNNNKILQVFYRGVWKGVCDDGFDAADGQVACRSMGGTYQRHETGVSGPSSEFWLDDLNCNGDESSLDSCSHSGIGSENCSSGEHVKLFCQGARRGPRNTRLGENSILQVRHQGEWRGVCDDGFDAADGQVACRSMGFEYLRHSTGVNGPSSEFWLDDLGCSGSEDNLFSCSHSGIGSENCSSGEHVKLVCGDRIRRRRN